MREVRSQRLCNEERNERIPPPTILPRRLPKLEESIYVYQIDYCIR